MASNYYFLVAGLPDIVMEENKSAPSVKAFVADIEDRLSPKDRELVRALLLPIDNRNLVHVLEADEAKFDQRGRWTSPELRDAVKWPENLPQYMQTFLEARKENRTLFPGLTAMDTITWLFYDEMAKYPNKFVREWAEFDLNFRNVLAGLNIRKGIKHIEALATDRDRPSAFVVIGRNDVAEAVLKSSAPDFGLGQEYPWVDRIIALSRQGLTDMEKGLDDLYWDMLNEMTVYSYFHVETIGAFVLKLQIVERWMKLSPAAGKARLDKLVEELMSSFVMPEGF